MLQVTARVFDNNQLVGYQITDGSQTQLFTRQQAWIYAKNKQLLNVVATGDETNPGLSGTNGFELKRLPEIKWKEPQSVKTSQKFNFTAQDMIASVIRHAVNNGNYTADKEYAKECLKTDVSNGIVTPQNCRALSNSLLVENSLCDGLATFSSIETGGVRYVLNPGIIGYKIKNISSQPIPITRMTATPDHTTSETVLNPGQSMCLNRAEMALLASKPEVGCTFANGKVVCSSKKTTISLHDFLARLYFAFETLGAHNKDAATCTDNLCANNPNIKLDVRRLVPKNILDSYFIGNSKYIQGDIIAAAIRHAVKTGQLPTEDNHAYVEARKQYLKDDATSGILTKENCRSLSNSILVENALNDANNPGTFTPLVIGYKIKNIGSQSIPITRMTATPDHTTSQTSLNPGQSMCLNRAEIALLASKPEIGCNFANAELVITSKKVPESLYKFLVMHFIYFDENVANVKEITIDIQSVESSSNISTYFIPNDTAKNIQQKGLFNAFKH